MSLSIITWRDVLDCKGFGLYRDISKIREVAKSANYEYFAWNGWVYKILDKGSERTDILVENVK